MPVTKKPVIITKQFKVVAVSLNCNSFGLHNHILVAKDGTAYEAAKTIQFKHEQGEILALKLDDDGRPKFAAHGFELPRTLPKPGPKLVKEMWGPKHGKR